MIATRFLIFSLIGFALCMLWRYFRRRRNLWDVPLSLRTIGCSNAICFPRSRQKKIESPNLPRLIGTSRNHKRQRKGRA